MANMRVYELARDLNLTNQILLEKLGEMDIAVKSHMSSLDEDTIARIKSQLFGKKEETIEETRIKPTVIRRRKKAVKVDVAPEIDPEAEAAKPDGKAPELEPSEETAAEIIAGDEVAAEPQTAEPAADGTSEVAPTEAVAEEAGVDEARQPEVKAKKAVKKAKKKEAAAKIIKLAPLKPLAKPKDDDKIREARPRKKAIGKTALADGMPAPAEVTEKETKKKTAVLFHISSFIIHSGLFFSGHSIS